MAEIQKPTAKVVNWCHGWTGGVKVRCSCGDWWVLAAGADGYAVDESIANHMKEKHG